MKYIYIYSCSYIFLLSVISEKILIQSTIECDVLSDVTDLRYPKGIHEVHNLVNVFDNQLIKSAIRIYLKYIFLFSRVGRTGSNLQDQGNFSLIYGQL